VTGVGRDATSGTFVHDSGMRDESNAPNLPDTTSDAASTVAVNSPARSLSVIVEPEGILVSGDRDSVDAYLARIRGVAGDGLSVIGVSRKSLADIGAIATSVGAIAAQAGDFVKISPASKTLLATHRILPGNDGYNLATVADAAGKFRGQIQWQSIALAPNQALAMQMAVATVALRTAIASVEAAVARVQGTVDKILVIASASRTGDVIGHHAVLARTVATLDSTGALPTADWNSIAGLGPELEVGVERLRNHIKRTLEGFDTSKPVQARASYLQSAVQDDRLGESLQLLVIAEDSLYLWQQLRIARIEETEPRHLAAVLADARALLAEHLERDSALLLHARAELATYAAIRPLEIVRMLSKSKMKRDMRNLRRDLDDFANARRSQVMGWQEYEDPSVAEALAVVGNRAMAIGEAVTGTAKGIAGGALDVGAAGIGSLGDQLQRVADTRRNHPAKAATTPPQSSLDGTEPDESGRHRSQR